MHTTLAADSKPCAASDCARAEVGNHDPSAGVPRRESGDYQKGHRMVHQEGGRWDVGIESNAVYLERISESDDQLFEDALEPEEARQLAGLLTKYADKLDEARESGDVDEGSEDDEDDEDDDKDDEEDEDEDEDDDDDDDDDEDDDDEDDDDEKDDK